MIRELHCNFHGLTKTDGPTNRGTNVYLIVYTDVPVLTEKAQEIQAQQLILVRAFREINFVVEIVAFQLRQVSFKTGDVFTGDRVKSARLQDVSRDQEFLKTAKKTLQMGTFIRILHFSWIKE